MRLPDASFVFVLHAIEGYRMKSLRLCTMAWAQAIPEVHRDNYYSGGMGMNKAD